MKTKLADILEKHMPAIADSFVSQINDHGKTTYTKMKPDQLRQSGERMVQAFIQDLRGEQTGESYARELAIKRASTGGYSLHDFTIAFRMLYDKAVQYLEQEAAHTAEDYGRMMALFADLGIRITAAFYESFTAQREAALAEREAALEASAEEQYKLTSMLRELSSPIVPVHDSILVLPLVGAIDTTRAQTITEDLLESIVRRQADIVIIDITGVPVVDTAIANYLLQTTKAVNLLGAQVILVGISAEVAQTIVGLDLDLAQLTVRANLQDGIAYALRLLGLQITDLRSLEQLQK